jgi:hypothetical protein
MIDDPKPESTEATATESETVADKSDATEASSNADTAADAAATDEAPADVAQDGEGAVASEPQAA